MLKKLNKMRNNQNLEWCMNLCRANLEMMKLSNTKIDDIVSNYSFFDKFRGMVFQDTSYNCAKNNMALRFSKQNRINSYGK